MASGPAGIVVACSYDLLPLTLHTVLTFLSEVWSHGANFTILGAQSAGTALFWCEDAVMLALAYSPPA